MTPQEKFQRFVSRYPHSRPAFYARPHSTRRQLFQIFGAGVTASCMLGRPAPAGVLIHQRPVEMRNRAKNVIFILMAGAPSHTDTFDFKEAAGVTPANFNPETIGGVRWPTGLMPKLGQQLADLAIVRSVRAWATGHSISQHWVQIGRNPSGALGDIAPNIGSVVAIEKYPERLPSQVLPSFIALNSGGGVGAGYLPATYDPMKLAPSAAGIPDTSNVDGELRMNNRYQLLHQLDDPLRIRSPYGKPLEDFGNFGEEAKALMYNKDVSRAFNYTSADSQRYGNTSFGNACLLANKVLAADLGTRFVQITLGGWDMHSNIYGANGRGGLYTLGKTFDDGVSAMLADLKAGGQLEQTLVVMMGEFGRTVGRLTGTAGRDHFAQQFAAFAGSGIKGGRAIGSTDDRGSSTVDPGWSRGRDVKPEDIEATIYSALGINWTSVRYDDPFGRGFEYVPFSNKEDLYGPIDELWS
ncbi:MAG TPA: DUF1501 domain-containing protein [Bryobacteraceae bacterium]|nr:DUF1501 domain-containing protein [Bryobacteraceae bacterium]